MGKSAKERRRRRAKLVATLEDLSPDAIPQNWTLSDWRAFEQLTFDLENDYWVSREEAEERAIFNLGLELRDARN